MLTDMNQSPTTLTLFCIKFNLFKRLGMAVGRFDHLEGFGSSWVLQFVVEKSIQWSVNFYPVFVSLDEPKKKSIAKITIHFMLLWDNKIALKSFIWMLQTWQKRNFVQLTVFYWFPVNCLWMNWFASFVASLDSSRGSEYLCSLSLSFCSIFSSNFSKKSFISGSKICNRSVMHAESHTFIAR